MAWKEINVEDQRKKFVSECLEGKFTMSELCRLYDISRQKGYKWLNRYKLGGWEALKNQSRAPLIQACKTNPELINEILDVRIRFRTWGPKKVLAWLENNHPEVEWPSTTTFGNIFDKNGLTVPRK